jgi:putative membrane protein
MSKTEEELALQEAWVRDCLAVERTVMANERTLLAYVRTALGFFIGGVSFLEFFESFYM